MASISGSPHGGWAWGRAELIDGQLSFLTYGPLEENVTAIARDGDVLWIGGADTYRAPARGITRYRLDTNAWEYFEANRIIGLDDPADCHDITRW